MASTKIPINKTALLVIDITNSCCHKKCETPKWNIQFKKIRAMVPRLDALIKKYRNAGGQVIFIDCVPWKKKYLAKNIVELYKDPQCYYYSPDRSGFSERFYLIHPDRKDFVVTKNTYDAFTNPHLNRFLKKKKIRYLIIAGVFGEGCVHATIQGGFSAGYNFIILRDLIETTDQPERQRLQKLFVKRLWPIMFGKTICSRDLFDYVKY